MDSHKSFGIGQSGQDPYLGTRQIHLPCCSGNTNSFGNRRLGVDGLNIDMAHVCKGSEYATFNAFHIAFSC